jgi:S1-C subfamily serine protease
MPDIPEDWALPRTLQPQAAAYAYDLDQALASVLALTAEIPDDAFTASILGTERVGSGVLIREDGVVLTIGYLVTEAENVTLKTGDGRAVAGHVLGYDHATGLGLVQALEPLDLPALRVGDSRDLAPGDSVVMAAGGGGRARAMRSRLQARQEFAGYWEYLLEEALFTAPAHPLWSGAAVIGASGELVGVGSLQMEQRGDDGRFMPLNMSVPAELLTPIFDDLVSGRATGSPRPWLGLLSQEVDEAVVAVGVTKGGPASRAEMREGDVIVGVGGTPVSDLASFYRRLWALGPAGVDVPLTLKRGSDVFDVEVRSADRRQLLKKPRYN